MNDIVSDTEIDEFIRIERNNFMEEVENFHKNSVLETQPCGNSIYATHPQQHTKKYHFSLGNEKGGGIGIVDGGPLWVKVTMNHKVKVDGRSSYCNFWRTTGPNNERKLEQAIEDGKILRCLEASNIRKGIERISFVLMSDTYIDDCGEIFRGYWVEETLISNDVVATGGPNTSKGRTVYEKPDGEKYDGVVEAYSGDTYPLITSNFDFFGPLLVGDIENIKKYKTMALSKTHILFGKDNLLFKEVVYGGN